MSTPKLNRVRAKAAKCQRCDLYKDATQTIFGSGSPTARLLLVGEEPGDLEDRKGKPFVGPAGKVLWQAIEEASIDRSDLYATNAVKHFRFALDERGKRRLHKTPTQKQIEACRPWLVAELQLVDPEVLLCLGAVAAKSLFGSDFKVTEHRGEELDLPPLEPNETDDAEAGPQPLTFVTVHPSAVLRAPDQQQAYDAFVADLRVVAKALRA